MRGGDTLSFFKLGIATAPFSRRSLQIVFKKRKSIRASVSCQESPITTKTNDTICQTSETKDFSYLFTGFENVKKKALCLCRT